MGVMAIIILYLIHPVFAKIEKCIPNIVTKIKTNNTLLNLFINLENF